MIRRSTYQQVSAWALMVIFTAGWSFKSLHTLFVHTADHNKSVCSIYYDIHAGGKHIHDERYSKDECSLCAFVLSSFEAPACLEFPVISKTVFHSISFPAESVFLGQSLEVTRLRGPPLG